MLTELHKLGVHPADVAELRGPELWEVGLQRKLEPSNFGKKSIQAATKLLMRSGGFSMAPIPTEQQTERAREAPCFCSLPGAK
jgi:hypothetical protein